MLKYLDYRIVTADDPNTLASKVRDYLADGYQLYGEVRRYLGWHQVVIKTQIDTGK